MLLNQITCISSFIINTCNAVKQDRSLFQRIATTFIQTREMSRVKIKRRKTHPFSWWQQRKIKYYKQDVTKPNVAFIQDYIKNKYESEPKESPLKEPPWPKQEWDPETRRCGVIARKIGIYPMWTKTGQRLLTTLLQVVDNHVINYIPQEKFADYPFTRRHKKNYACLVVGAEAADPQLFSAEYNSLFNKAGVQTKRKLARFTITPNAVIQPGTPLYATHFRVGDYVDVYGKTVGHGFQGVVKRWGMKGGPASHGTTKAHRRVGSIGSGRECARVRPGKKMPGHMGQERRYLRGLKIWRINTKYNVLYVHGPAVPGSVHAFVHIFDSCVVDKKPKEAPPFPTFYPENIAEELPEDLYDKDLHPFTDPSIIFPEDDGKKVKVKTGAKTAAKR